MSDPKSDAEVLMNRCLDMAEHLLQKNGEFYPYGAGLKQNREVGPRGGEAVVLKAQRRGGTCRRPGLVASKSAVKPPKRKEDDGMR